MPLRGAMTGGNDGLTSALTSATMTLPAGCVPGDIGVILTASNITTSDATLDAGWGVIVGPISTGGNNRSSFWAKTLTATDIATGTVGVSWSGGSGRVICAGAVLFGAEAVGAVGSAVSATTPSVATAVLGSDVLLGASTRTAAPPAVASTYPAGFTKVVDAKTAISSGSNMAASLAMLTTPGAAGSYGGGTVTFSPAPSNAVTYAVAIRHIPGSVIVGGVKKLVVRRSVIIGGAKKPVTNWSAIVGGVKKAVT
jgi:hypothetical protein